MKKHKRLFLIIIIAVAVLAAAAILLYYGNYYNIIPKQQYSAADFGIETIKSTVDFNDNGIDDFSDILKGAKDEAARRPKYDGSYFDGGYPPDDIGVCTDLVWRAFKQAGYDLKAMVDKDIEQDPNSYPHITEPDPNIDFRRVSTLRVFFKKYAQSLTIDADEIDKWQPGDIVIYNNKHIAIVSDIRGSDGQSYILHNAGLPKHEEDALTRMEITEHLRFDASKIDSSVLIAFTD
jgi:putative periplasmic protein